MKSAVKTPRWLGVDLVKNRWIFPLLGALATILGGATYAFSIFIRPLEAEFGWTRTETVSAFSVAMFAFGSVMWIGGFFVDKYGPRIPFAIGSILMVASQVLSSRINTVTELIISFGIIGGIGIGLVYSSATIAVSSRWFPEPEKRGLALGASITGFGLGAIVAAPLWAQGIALYGWRTTYLLTGVVFALVLFVIGTILRFPPSDWKFVQGKGWQPLGNVTGESNVTEETNKKSAPQPAIQSTDLSFQSTDLSFAQAVRTPQLWVAGLMFLLCMIGGLMAVGQLAAFAGDAPPAGVGLAMAVAASLIMLQALSNGAGRPIWGGISGKIGIRPAYLIVVSLMALAMLVLSVTQTLPVLIIGVFLTGFAFGGTLALNPILSVAFFGPSFIARIYGLIFFLGFGFGGLLGPMIGGYIRSTTGSYSIAFLAAAGCAILALVVGFFFIPKPGEERLTVPASR